MLLDTFWPLSGLKKLMKKVPWSSKIKLVMVRQDCYLLECKPGGDLRPNILGRLCKKCFPEFLCPPLQWADRGTHSPQYQTAPCSCLEVSVKTANQWVRKRAHWCICLPLEMCLLIKHVFFHQVTGGCLMLKRRNGKKSSIPLSIN